MLSQSLALHCHITLTCRVNRKIGDGKYFSFKINMCQILIKSFVFGGLFFFFFFFLTTPQHMEFPGQGSDLSCSCNLSCSTAGSLTHCARPGIKPVSQGSQDSTNPVAPQQELLLGGFVLPLKLGNGRILEES